MKPKKTKNPNKPVPLRIEDIIPSTASSSSDEAIVIPKFDLGKQFLSGIRKRSSVDRKSPAKRKETQVEPLRPSVEESCSLGRPISHDQGYQSESSRIISAIVKRDIVRMQRAMQSKSI